MTKTAWMAVGAGSALLVIITTILMIVTDPDTKETDTKLVIVDTTTTTVVLTQRQREINNNWGICSTPRYLEGRGVTDPVVWVQPEVCGRSLYSRWDRAYGWKTEPSVSFAEYILSQWNLLDYGRLRDS